MSAQLGRSGAAASRFLPSSPAAQNLDDTNVLAAFDALRLFGQARSPEAPPDADEGRQRAGEGEAAARMGPDPRRRPRRSHARARTFGCSPTSGRRSFEPTACRPSRRCSRRPRTGSRPIGPEVYPLLDEDAIARRNALNCLADPMAVVDRVWRLPLVDSRQHGRFSLRDIEIARGQAPPGPTEARAGRGGYPRRVRGACRSRT